MSDAATEMPKLSIIVPVFNEARTIGKTIEKLAGLNLVREIIVVDDGSLDETPEILKEFDEKIIKITRHSANQGKGAALRSGIAEATGDFIIFCDADLEYDIEQIPELFDFAVAKSYPVVFGSRFINYSPKKNLSHYIGNRFLTWATNCLFGSELTDMETGYKLFKSEIIKDLSLQSRGFDIEPEITAKLLKRGVKIIEFPINYDPRGKAEGKKIKYRDGLTALKVLLRERFF